MNNPAPIEPNATDRRPKRLQASMPGTIDPGDALSVLPGGVIGVLL
jgi:hypothetical protein